MTHRTSLMALAVLGFGMVLLPATGALARHVRSVRRTSHRSSRVRTAARGRTAAATGEAEHGGEPIKTGVERWKVKTGADAAAQNISMPPFNPAPNATIAQLNTLSQPANLPGNTRLAGERKVYTVDAAIEAFKLEQDGDYHIVLVSGGKRLIAEIPLPDFVSTSSPWGADISTVRQALEDRFQLKHDRQTSDMGFTEFSTPVPVRISGVAFFDFAHGQRGHAANYIELHPVLRLQFTH